MLKSTTVRQFMARELVTFSPTTDIVEAINVLVTKKISGAPVIDNHGNLVGILSEKDCMKVALNMHYHQDFGGPVSEYMHTDVKTVQADTSIVEVAEMFFTSSIRRYPVFEDNRLVGQISRRDVLRALQAKQ